MASQQTPYSGFTPQPDQQIQQLQAQRAAQNQALSFPIDQQSLQSHLQNQQSLHSQSSVPMSNNFQPQQLAQSQSQSQMLQLNNEIPEEGQLQQDMFSQNGSLNDQNMPGMGNMPFYGNVPLPPNQGVLNRANLQYEGCLEDMMFNWTDEEKTCRRRLVQFWRRHENNTIFCRFRPVSPPQKTPSSILISCIYWEEKGSYVVTSVDCITLLESLISVRFTVEEKNRIRRNLEGFRPLTVAKCKPDTAEFFKLIMAFPNPKPRNIEKDVKVFPWRILSYALQKIVSKYAAGFTPAYGLGMGSFNGGFSNLSSGMHSPIGQGSQRLDAPFNSGIPARANLQRRFSQPVNSLSNMGRFHPYGVQGAQGNRFASNFTSRNPSISEIPDDFSLKESQEVNLNQRPPGAQSNEQLLNPSDIGEHSLASLNLESSFGNNNFMSPFPGRSGAHMNQDFVSGMTPMMQGSNFRQQSGPRRHSLADPYSLQRFQAARLGINPMGMGNTPGESPPTFDFNSAQSGLMNSNASYTIKEEDEYPLDGHDNGNMMTTNGQIVGMRGSNQQSFSNNGMRSNDNQNNDPSLAFMNSQRNFNQLQAAGIFNGMQFNMQTSSGEENQAPPAYST